MVTKNKPTPSDAPVADAVPMAEPEGGWPADEFSGLGGQYVRDPLTGKRSKAPEATE